MSCLTSCWRHVLSVFNKPRLARPYVCAADGPLDLARVAKLIEDPNAQVVVMAGAGVSTSAGIPDFRTPGTGLYDNLQEYGLPYPEAIFDLGFYRSNPKPFQRLCKELWPGNFAPTPTHAFIKVLHDEGKESARRSLKSPSGASAHGRLPSRPAAETLYVW